MTTNSSLTHNLISWSSSLCSCFPSLPDMTASMPPQQLYDLHRRSSPKCLWFVQSNEAQRQSAVQTLQQQQHQQTIQHQQQQQTEEVFRPTEAFDCRRCPASFASNTKLHQHIRDHHAKKPKTSTPSTSSPSAASPPWKTITNTIHTPPRTPCLTNHVTRPVSPPKPFATSTTILTSPPSYPCLTNHVTRPTSITSPTPYLTVKDLYSMFHQKSRSSSRSAMTTHLSSASPSGMPSRQTRITSYFKSIARMKLASMRKCADLRLQRQWTQISDLTVASPCTFIDLSVNSLSANSMTNSFANDFSSLFNFWLHRRPTSDRKTCMKRPQQCCLHEMK